MTRNPHIGTSLDDLLQEDGVLAEVNDVALQRVLDWQRTYNVHNKTQPKSDTKAHNSSNSSLNFEAASCSYIGLPEHLSRTVAWVAFEYETHPSSHIQGGVDVVLEYHDGRVIGFDYLEKPANYIRTLFARIVECSPDLFNSLNEKQKLEIAKDKISRIFVRKYEDSNERATASFVEVWNSTISDEIPWQDLEIFAGNEKERI